MSQFEGYTIWVKPVSPAYDYKSIIANVEAMPDVVSVSANSVDIAGITKKEAVLAVALSVTANFATDGLKAIFAHFEEEDAAKVVLCRRPDGSDVPLNSDPAED